MSSNKAWISLRIESGTGLVSGIEPKTCSSNTLTSRRGNWECKNAKTPQGFRKFTGKVKRHAFVFEPSFEKVLIAIIHMQLLPSRESKPTSFHNKYMFSQVLKINIYRSSDSLVIWPGVQNSNKKTQKASVSHRGSGWMMLVTALSPGDVMTVRRMRRSENSNSGLSQCSASPLCVDQRGWRRWERAWGSVFGGQPFILS